MADRTGASTRMSPPILHCQNCESLVSVFDQYCGVCEVALAALRWSLPGEKDWQSGNGHVAVHAGATSAGVAFRNVGAVPAGLVLRIGDMSSLPDWIDHRSLSEGLGREPLILEGGDDRTVEIPIHPERLARFFASDEGSRPGSRQRQARLLFMTNLHEERNGLWTSIPFEVVLLLARPPRIAPASSFYRFLAVERLAGEGLEHEIEIFNETIRKIELARGTIVNDRASTPPGYEFVSWESLVRGAPLEPPAIEASSSWKGALRLGDPGLSPERLGWFAFTLEYPIQSPLDMSPISIQCRVEGRLGRGPTLEAQGPRTLGIPLNGLQREHVFTLRNPGQIPVAVEAVEVWRDRKGMVGQAPERDWLALSGLSPGDVLGPGETRALVVRSHPARRPSDEFDEAVCRRTLRVRHDGLAGPAAGRWLELEILATFGKAVEVLAGIDFGTTNSVVCVGGLRGSYPLSLEFGPKSRQDHRIRSLMYFDSQGLKGDAEPFLFGDDANSSAAIRPENLVRSIKSVVARDPRARYVFYQRIAGQSELPVTKTPHELLDLFISELRERSEHGVSYLPAEAYEALEVDLGTQLTFSRAVFSHPVEMPGEARQALMLAAHRAGINEATKDVDEFFEQHCIDEATASVLAYCGARVQGQALVESEPGDCERVLSFDMGGGTTDLAAVEILNMATLLADPEGEIPVTVKLEDKAGSRFGGDDLDRALALRMLSEIRRKSERDGAPVAIDEIRRALQAGSYPAFQVDYQRRHGTLDSGTETRVEDVVSSLYKLADTVLTEAETAKCALTSLESVTSILPGTGWPREKSDPQAESANFEIQVLRTDFEEMVRAKLKDRLPLLDGVVLGAGWEWPSVTTLLFTGQSARIPVIREEVARYVTQHRGEKAPPLLRIDPGQGGFDPKNCVAIGAVLWGTSGNAGSWLEIQDRVRGRLTFDVRTEMGPRLRPVKGLQKGQALPAKGTVKIQKGSTELKLFREGKKGIHARFRFAPLREGGEITVWVRGLGDYFVEVDGQEIKGEVLS
jgi:molecular chaperone DnaK (HSP70)